MRPTARAGLSPRLLASLRSGAMASALVLSATAAPASPGAAARETLPAMSPQALALQQWVRQSADNEGLPYIVIDKRNARLWTFDPAGGMTGSTPVLLGWARGDASVPGIGERPLKSILPHERTTPAGRFVAEPGRNLKGEDIFWVDYDAAVSMHRVRATNAAERRLQRLASATPADNRISYGCINVPAAFYDAQVRPLLAGGRGVVYLLPETMPLAALFTGAAEPSPEVRRSASKKPRAPT